MNDFLANLMLRNLRAHRWLSLASQPRGIKTSRVKDRHDLDLYVIDLREEHPPKGEESLSWTLLTTLQVKGLDAAIDVMSYYRMRWNIELYFKCLKSGCGVEKCRLNDGEKIASYVALMSVVAWRIMWMTYLKRAQPDESCEIFLTKSEWKTLWIKRNYWKIREGKVDPTPPSSPPTVYEAVRWIAGLGGFFGRKNDGEPGILSVWSGWLQLTGAAQVYDVLNF